MDSTTNRVLKNISGDDFEEWYRKREEKKNIEKGKAHYNGAAPVPPPEKHSPSSLLQCHRKLVYRQENAPEEQNDPRGIFRFGNQYDEEAVWKDVIRTNVLFNFVQQLKHIGVLAPETHSHSEKIRDYDPNAKPWIVRNLE